MSYRATRGVCIGVGRHLSADDPAPDLDPATVAFLVSIGALKLVKDEPQSIIEPESKTPEKTGKKEK